MAQYAFSLVQNQLSNSGSGTTVVVTSSATVAGNLIVGCIQMGGVTETCSSVTDDKSNTYVVQAAVDSGGIVRGYQFYGVQTTGGTTSITANFSGSSVSKIVNLSEFSGNDTTNGLTFDATTTGSGSSSSLSCSTLTPAASGELVVASYWIFGAQFWTAGARFVACNGFSASLKLGSQYILSCGATETGPCTLDFSQAYGGRITSFKAKAETGSKIAWTKA